MEPLGTIVTYTYEGLPGRRAQKPDGAQTPAAEQDDRRQPASLLPSGAVVNITYDPVFGITTLTYDPALLSPKQE